MDPTKRKPPLINFGLIQLTANDNRNEASQLSLLGDNFQKKKLPHFFDQATAFRKPADINDGWIRYVRAIQRRLLDAGISTTQPLSSAVSHGKELYNTNSPSASPVTVV